MSDNYNGRNRNKKKSRYEKIGFYTSLSICLIAVSMAVYSTYSNISDTDSVQTKKETTVAVQEVNQDVTGVTEIITQMIEETQPTQVTAVAQIYEPIEEFPTEVSQGDTRSALQTMLSTNLSLTYPLDSNNIIREYSEKTAYYKTLNVWKPHLGVDFAGELGDNVYAMTGGAVTKIYEDKLYGKTVEVSIDNAVIIYSGMGLLNVSEGESVDAASKIGVMGTVPCEANDVNHIHIAVKIDGKYADPISFLNNNE